MLHHACNAGTTLRFDPPRHPTLHVGAVFIENILVSGSRLAADMLVLLKNKVLMMHRRYLIARPVTHQLQNKRIYAFIL